MKRVYDGVSFEPWVGKNYDDGRVKLLLLGESHYGSDIGKNETANAVNDYMAGRTSYRFFSGAVKTAFGPGAGRDRLDDVALYNYVQSVLGEPGARPAKKMWEEAETPFKTVMEQLMPDEVLCLGAALYSHLPGDWDRESRAPGAELFREGRLWCKEYHYRINGRDIPVYGILHPSSRGFNAAAYHEKLKAYLKQTDRA